MKTGFENGTERIKNLESFQVISKTVPGFAKEIGQKIGNVSKELAHDLKGLNILSKTQRKMNEFVRLKIEKMIIKYLQKQPKRIKKALKDPDMCQCVQNLIDDLVSAGSTQYHLVPAFHREKHCLYQISLRLRLWFPSYRLQLLWPLRILLG